MDNQSQKRNDNAADAVKRSLQEVEVALKGLAKLTGAIRFYPVGHPALKDVTREARQGLLHFLRNHDLCVVQIRRDSFLYNEKPLGENPILQKLAGSLFARRVQRLTVQQDVTSRDLWFFAQILLTDPLQLQKQGGIVEALVRAKVSTLWVNVVDLSTILEIKRQLEEDKAALYGVGEEAEEKFLEALGAGGESMGGGDFLSGEHGGAAGDEMTLERLLQEIERNATDQGFATLLPQLPHLLRANLNMASASLVLRALVVVNDAAKSPMSSQSRREVSLETLSQLATDDILSFIVDLLCEHALADEQRLHCLKIVDAFGTPLAHILMARLADERDQAIRKNLSESLIRLGRAALPAVLPLLRDERWYVVRNATSIIGEIRDPATVEQLKPGLQHHDLRVRRETIRAMSRIGGNSVVGILLRTLQGEDQDLRRQAMLSLGAMKNPVAVSPLIHFVQHPDWRLKHLEGKKDAIRALGEIGSGDALPALTALALEKRFFYHSRHNELRAAAASAIGEIGGENAIRVLEKLSEAAPLIVSRAAGHALKQARKAYRK